MEDHANFEEKVAQFERDSNSLAVLTQSVAKQHDEIKKFLVTLAQKAIQERNIPLSGFSYSVYEGSRGFQAYTLEHLPATVDAEGCIVAMTESGAFFEQFTRFDKQFGIEMRGEPLMCDISHPYHTRMIYRVVTDPFN